MYEGVRDSTAYIMYDWWGGLMVSLPLKIEILLPIMGQTFRIAVFSQT